MFIVFDNEEPVGLYEDFNDAMNDIYDRSDSYYDDLEDELHTFKIVEMWVGDQGVICSWHFDKKGKPIVTDGVEV